ncbi:MAG: SDR family oxidoreductase [Burkholderiaceae bacterium]
MPAEVTHECKRILLDSFGVAMAAVDVDKGRIGVEHARLIGAGWRRFDGGEVQAGRNGEHADVDAALRVRFHDLRVLQLAQHQLHLGKVASEIAELPCQERHDDGARRRDEDFCAQADGIDLARVTAFAGQALAAKLLVVQAAVPAMQARGGGSVVFVTSEGDRSPTPGQTAIAALSGGLMAASKVMSKDLARDRIRVDCVCVTVVRDTPSWTAVFGADSTVSDMHRRQ